MQYIVGPKVNKSASIPASGEKKEDTQEEYEKALKDFKIKWMKLVLFFGLQMCINFVCIHTCICFFRCGVLSTEQLEEDYAEDVDFLMGKLEKIAEDEDVSVFFSGYVRMYIRTHIFCTERNVCNIMCNTQGCQ